jgi:redox-sensing transcriptional repressor
MGKYVSMAVVKRLPRYYRYIDELYGKDINCISSRELAEQMGLTASQIRQDFNCFGGFGQQGYGYNVGNLRNEIARILGLDSGYKAILLGVGNLGHALLNNFAFDKRGFSLTAAFDKDKKFIGSSINGVSVYDIEELEQYCKVNLPQVAILTVPRSVAPELARKLTACGVRGLWNFTNIDLNRDLKDKDVVVENVHFSDSLMTLCYRISETSK